MFIALVLPGKKNDFVVVVQLFFFLFTLYVSLLTVLIKSLFLCEKNLLYRWQKCCISGLMEHSFQCTLESLLNLIVKDLIWYCVRIMILNKGDFIRKFVKIVVRIGRVEKSTLRCRVTSATLFFVKVVEETFIMQLFCLS